MPDSTVPIAGSSPHTRGAPQLWRRPPRRSGIIPAYAGSTNGLVVFSLDPQDHPRIRGEHSGLGQWSRRDAGSSPHTRGARDNLLGDGLAPGIIPAYAGSTDAGDRYLQRTRDHPRIRGEHRHNSWTNPLARGSSPHTRGARFQLGDDHLVHGIIPAYAGSTLGNPCNTKDRRRDYTSFPLPVTHPSGGGGS